MLHHVALEVDPARIEDESRFWVAVGFAPAPVPESLGNGYSWFEKEGTQVHLMHTAEPVVPPRGHTAIVVKDFDASVARLEGEGFKVTEGRQHWGERRAKMHSPSGHSVEIMAAPPVGRAC